MKNILYIAVILIFAFSCESDKWDDHYKVDNQIIDSRTVKEVVAQNKNITEFLSLLKEVDYLDRLNSKEFITVLAPQNGTFDISGLNTAEKVQFVKSHLIANRVIIENIQQDQRFITLMSKYMKVSKSEQGYVINGSAKVSDQQTICANGAFYVVDSPIKSVNNLYENIFTLDDDYSIFRDTILAHQDTIFDVANSLPVGINATGQVVYDSVFVYNNDLFEYTGPLQNEEKLMTLIVPNNEQITDAQSTMFNYIEQKKGAKPTKEDTLRVKRNTYSLVGYDILIDEEYPSSIESFGYRIWRGKKQGRLYDRVELSNGYMYKTEGFKIPAYNYLAPLIYKPALYYDDRIPQETKDACFVFGEGVRQDRPGVVVDESKGGAFQTIFSKDAVIDFNDGLETNVWIECQALYVNEKDGTSYVLNDNVVPGTYEVKFSCKDFMHPDVQIYVNGKEVGGKVGREGTGYNMQNNPKIIYDKTIGYYTHKGDDPEKVFVRIELAGTDPDARLVPFRVVLVPTDDVY
ncbi:MAG: fasciclin domain-containing protein [Carboxylicivirga sp.]|jgi:hypothetical protein|nr:fasciclin domain-containing protein [Carboxylicivirga sp.]